MLGPKLLYKVDRNKNQGPCFSYEFIQGKHAISLITHLLYYALLPNYDFQVRLLGQSMICDPKPLSKAKTCSGRGQTQTLMSLVMLSNQKLGGWWCHVLHNEIYELF